MIDTKKILKFILEHIDAGTIDQAFNAENLNEHQKTYNLEPFGIIISTDLLDDVIRNPEHYRKLISQEDNPAQATTPPT